MEGGERCALSSWKYGHYFELLKTKKHKYLVKGQPSPARSKMAVGSGSGRESKLYVAVNSTLVLPRPMLTYSIPNIFKCIISQNPDNLDPVGCGSGFACGDHAERKLEAVSISLEARD